MGGGWEKEIVSRVSSRESFWLGLAIRSQGEGVGELFIVQSDPGYSRAGYPFHGFIGLVPLLLFKGFLTFGDVAAKLVPNCRKNEKRIKIILPYVSNSYKPSDQGKGANCVVKIESGALGWGRFPSLFSVHGNSSRGSLETEERSVKQGR